MSDTDKWVLATSKEENRESKPKIFLKVKWKQSFPSPACSWVCFPDKVTDLDMAGKSQGPWTRSRESRHWAGRYTAMKHNDKPYLHSFLFNIIKFVVLKHCQKLSCLVDRVDQILSDFLSLVCTAAATQFFLMEIRKEKNKCPEKGHYHQPTYIANTACDIHTQSPLQRKLLPLKQVIQKSITY